MARAAPTSAARHSGLAPTAAASPSATRAPTPDRTLTLTPGEPRRKGYARIADIPARVLARLNAGLEETATLSEFLAIDLSALMAQVAADIGLPLDQPAVAERLADTAAMLPSFKPMKRHAWVATSLYAITAALPSAQERDACAQRLAHHTSDVPRCWAAQWVGFSGLDVAGQLQAIAPFAADSHFGVREIAWMAVRDAVAADLDNALALLLDWTAHADPNIRRFASELTRPKGVWCAPIKALKTEPWQALALLAALRADPSRYVQNSVANWLNDAAKSQPQWVAQLCEQWLRESPTPATAYIAKRAQRSL